MKTNLGITLVKNKQGFKRYIQYQFGYIKHEIIKFEMFSEGNEEELYRFSIASKIVQLDKAFREKLTEREKDSLRYLAYHNPNDSKPITYIEDVDSSYIKWIHVFFSKSKPIIRELDKKRLGSILRRIRKMNNFKTQQLADAIGVSKKTVENYENSKTYPDTYYLFKFSNIFNISADEIFKFSIK